MMIRLLVVAGVMGVLAGCRTTTTARLKLPPVETVPQVDLQRYAGTWYEIAAFPQRFQKGCYATTARYSLRDDGEIEVINRCRKGPEGKVDVARGRARVVEGGKLEVTFFWPFWGEYWIIDLDDDYQYAVVGHPSRDYLWILSRTPAMDPDLYEAIVARARDQGFEVSRLVKTVQPEAD